jgi:undecaprenyl-diphosphatase
MDYMVSIFLAVIQGLTEFLPVSSSGHLVILQHLTAYEGSKLLFNVVVHLGTLLAVILYFSKDIIKIISGFFSEVKTKKRGDYTSLVTAIIIANIPAAITGLFFRDFFAIIYEIPWITSLMLLVTATLLILTKQFQDKGKYDLFEITLLTALIIGISQAIAILPGISRAGITIATAMFLMVEKNSAAKFSFIASIPVIGGAFLLEASHAALFSDIFTPILLISMLASFLTGLLALKMLTFIISRNKLYLFSYYLIPAGIITLIIFLI